MSGRDFAVKLLEGYTEACKRGLITSIGLCVVDKHGNIASGFGGEVNFGSKLLEACGQLQTAIQGDFDNWQLPPPDLTLDESYACYNCGDGPQCFDFVVWLVIQDMIRVMAGKPGPLKVAIWTGRKPFPNLWVEKVYRPAIGLIGAVEDPKALGRPGFRGYTAKYVCQMARAGWPVPVLKPKGVWNLPRGVVTITLREADYWPHRNSNVGAWFDVANWLESQGERVVFVRDTAKANMPLDPYEICPQASLDLDARMWLYDNAKLNCFVSNGPWSLAQFSDKPLLCFTPPEPDGSVYEANTPAFWRRAMGIEIGEQFPWHSPQQRLVFEKDSYENIVRAYEALNL